MTVGSGADATPPKSPGARGLRRIVVFALVIAVGAAGLWATLGKRLWSEYESWLRESRATEASAPVGYVGLHYRRSYNDRPLVFHAEKDGRKLLFAAKGEGTTLEYYDVTEAGIDVSRLDGGFGRDSIPGVDYPIIDGPDAKTGRALRASQAVFGVVLGAGPRAYPKDLLEKIEVVNDADGNTPLVVVYDRAVEQARVFPRTVGGAAVTFGTTGYTLDRHPLLYDRKTHSLWLSGGDELHCVNGDFKGNTLTPLHKPDAITWGDWKAGHSESSALMGSDRDKPIQAQ
jgi:hypothetical protein